MRYVVMVVVLLTGTTLGISPPTASTPAARQTKREAVSPAEDSILMMVFIRVASAGAIKQLRAMHIDIVRVRPDPDRHTDDNSLKGSFIVEAVVPKDMLPKLKAMGFDVSEVLPKDK